MLFATSLFACILSFHSFVTRYFFSLSSKGVARGAVAAAPQARFAASASVLTSIVVAVLVAVAALLQLDPINQFYTWLGGISSVGVVVLLVITNVAIIAIFRRDTHSLSLWKTVSAPVIGLIALLAFLFVILQNLPVLVGEPSYGPFSHGVLALLVLAFAAGPVVAHFRKGVELS